MSFASLGLAEPILKGVAAAGYESPTEIQARAIPLFKGGQNLIGLGETGSGKTAAYGLPMLDRLLGGESGLRGLILVPTRELCVQVAENLRNYASATGLEIRTAFGGIPITIQESAFKRGMDILVACPGRLIDHLTCGNLSLDRIETFVLDEADRMLDMGFIPQIRKILTRLPAERQNGMFSATMPPEVERLVKDYFGEAEVVQVGRRSQAALSLTHRFEEMPASDKLSRLERLLDKRRETVLIFVKTKKRAEELGSKLKRSRLPADSIHGDKSAESRHVVLQAFARGKVRFLVATDVAARGIDVSDIGLVVNFDMPRSPDDYVHRVGRTGRAGSEGEALSFVTRPDKGVMRAVLAHLAKSSAGQARIVVDGKEMPSSERPAERSEKRRPRERARADRPKPAKSERRPPRERRPAERPGADRDARKDLASRSGVRLKSDRPARDDDASDVLFGGNGAESPPPEPSGRQRRRRRRSPK